MSFIKRFTKRFHSVPLEFRVVAKDVAQHVTGSRMLTEAAALSYTTILSVIPALAVSFATFKAFGGMDQVYATIEPLIIKNLAEGSSEAIVAIRGFIANVHTGAIGLTGFLGLIVTSMAMLYSIETSINNIWKSPMHRNFWQRIATYWLFITMGPLALSITIGVLTSMAIPFKALLPGGTGFFIITSLGFFLVFKLVPNKKVRWEPALVAGMLTAAGWSLARAAYTIYTMQVITYSKIYGALGAVPILLLWIYIVWVIVLSGAAVSAALQKGIEAGERAG